MGSVRRLSVLGYAAVLVLAVQLGRSASAGGSAGPIPFDGGTIHQPLKIASGTAASNYFDFVDSTGAPLSAAGHGTIEYINGTGFRASVNGGAYATLVTGSAASTFQQVYDASTGPPMITTSGYTMQFQSTTATMGNFGADDAIVSLIRSGSNSANPTFEVLALTATNNSADGLRVNVGSNASFLGAGIRVVNSGDGAGIDMNTTTNGDTGLLGVGVKIKCVASAGLLFADGGGTMGAVAGAYHVSFPSDKAGMLGTRGQSIDFYNNTTKTLSLTSTGNLLIDGGNTPAQNATAGFLVLSKCATGAPSGAAPEGTITEGGDNHLWARLNSAWVQVDGGGGGGVSWPLTIPTGVGNTPQLIGPTDQSLQITTGGTSGRSISLTTPDRAGTPGSFLVLTGTNTSAGSVGAVTLQSGPSTTRTSAYMQIDSTGAVYLIPADATTGSNAAGRPLFLQSGSANDNNKNGGIIGIYPGYGGGGVGVIGYIDVGGDVVPVGAGDGIALLGSTSACWKALYTSAVNSTGTNDLTLSTAGSKKIILGNAASVQCNVQLTALAPIVMSDEVTQYNNVATAGLGVPAIYAAGSSTAQTGNVTGLATFTPAADGDFEVSESINVTAYTAGTLAGTVTYKDEGGTSRTLTLNFSSVGGTLGTTVGAAGAYEGVSLHIRAQASTAIVYQVTGTAFTGTYNVRACTRQLQ